MSAPIFTAAISKLTSGLYLATLTDQTGALVAGSTLTAATLTLTAKASKAVVNGWSAKNILNANGWTFYDTLQSVTIAGVVYTYNAKWVIVPADNTVLDTSEITEPHIAEIVLAWNGGAGGAVHWFELDVANLVTT